MCGIAGALFFDAPSHDQSAAIVQRMSDALAHRGPDGQGVVVCPARERPAAATVAFGHRRLAIIDLTDRAAQPMKSADGSCWLTFNGEIYNFREIRRELERCGRTFVSDSDTEVILHVYQEWGVSGFEKLRGMFAFALWDDERQVLLLVRDRLGIKPLYVARIGRAVLFASELRSILASELVPRRLDPTAVWQYLGYQTVPAPRTLIEGVRLLEPGSLLTVEASGRVQERQYWDLMASASPCEGQVSSETAVRRVRELLDESVNLHLVSDVPVAVFLSGGIDSSAIAALVRDAGRTPLSFSIGFTDLGFDESRFARASAERVGAEHTHLELSEQRLLESLPGALAAMDHPTGDGINSYVVSQAVRQAGVKVALSGLGGDELFGGYPSFARLERARHVLAHWGSAPRAVRGAAAGLVRAIGSSVAASKVASVLDSDGSLASAWSVTRQLLSPEQRTQLLAPEWLANADRTDPYVARLTRAFENAPDAELWSQVSYAEARTYMHDVLLRDIDQMSMAHGLEVRVPLLDHRLAEYVIGLPDSCKRLDEGPKPLLVRAMGGELPDEIVHRPKQGFTLPFDPWMRSALRSFCAERLGPRGLGGRGLVRPDAVQQMWTRFLSGDRRTSWSRVWTLVTLDAWLDANSVS
ncbi:MAG: asparagine synthase (glutamine-hydrolyzing) [Vicinamibacterales bacterium]